LIADMNPTSISAKVWITSRYKLWLVLSLAQDVEKKKAEPKTQHLLSSKQDIVAWSQEKKFRLKHAMLSPTKKKGEFVLNLDSLSLPRFGNLR